EQIIMQALSLHREQRFSDASLMAQELRALQLKPAPSSETPNTLQTRPQGQNRPSMQPPKRPQVQRPRYMDVDMEQTLPPPSAPMTPPSQHLLYDQQQQASQRVNDALSSIEPVHYRHMSPSPYTPLPEDVKTASLESLQKPQARRSFWGQLQKLFKPSR
nr:hypothetical protein [Ktedonobacteraceae bacterium]